MKDFRTVTLADQVFERLESDIIQGVYPRGEVLTELKLVEQLNVSRTPIREALRRLEQEHLIADTGKGSVVLGITAEDLVDIMDIRCRIEGLASTRRKTSRPRGLRACGTFWTCRSFTLKSATPSTCARWTTSSTTSSAT